MSRVLSYTEITTALDCWAKWDFRYGDQLAGSSLKEKQVAPLLSGGRAWGAAVAAWHTHVDRLDAGVLAIEAMDRSLDEDAQQQIEFGIYRQDEHAELRERLLARLAHYMDTAEAVLMDPVVERELLVPIPSRTGVRSSSRYKMLCYLDATETDADGNVWINEFKLRGTLTSVELITLSPQNRWYAWAYWRLTGIKPAGTWVNERLNEAPKPPRMVKSGRKDGSLIPSHAKDQMCTAVAYEENCREHDVEPLEETLANLRARRWQQRVPIVFRDRELEDAGHELVSAAKLIHQLDTGELEPIRNVKRTNCGWCPFRDVCPNPDSELVDALFERKPAKRNREEESPPPAGIGSTEGAAT